MRGREVANPRPSRPQPKFRRNLGDQRRFLRKIRNFSKKFSSFFTTFRPKSRLSISKGRSPIRARVRTTPVFGKKADGSTAERRAGEDLTRAADHGPATQRRRHSSARPRRDSGLASPSRRGQKLARRAPAGRSSRSRERTVAFAAAGRHLRKIEQTSKKK